MASVKVDGAAIDGAYIKLVSVKNKPNIRAKVDLDILQNGERKRKPKELKKNDDLLEITKLQQYEGFIVNDIYTQPGNEYIEFINGTFELLSQAKKAEKNTAVSPNFKLFLYRIKRAIQKLEIKF
ncbi:MAG: hypothetical protein NVV59_11960 [Chitinophagaceae bacterium]|nr:hypothetical protein [Chitinophagaceae bacterium]